MGRDLDGFTTDDLLEEVARRRGNIAIAHPRDLEFRQVENINADMMDLVATAADGLTLTIRATRVLWHSLLFGGPQLSPAAHAQDLYLRGIIDVAELERRLTP